MLLLCLISTLIPALVRPEYQHSCQPDQTLEESCDRSSYPTFHDSHNTSLKWIILNVRLLWFWLLSLSLAHLLIDWMCSDFGLVVRK